MYVSDVNIDQWFLNGFNPNVNNCNDAVCRRIKRKIGFVINYRSGEQDALMGFGFLDQGRRNKFFEQVNRYNALAWQIIQPARSSKNIGNCKVQIL